MNKVFIRCHEEKPIEDFPYKSFLRGTRQTVCKTCTAKRSREWYADNKESQRENVRVNRGERCLMARDYLLTHPCEGILPDGSRCTESDPVVLEFHHVRGKKSPKFPNW